SAADGGDHRRRLCHQPSGGGEGPRLDGGVRVPEPAQTSMTKRLEQAIATVRELSEEAQDRAAQFLLGFANPEADQHQLSPEQLAEVELQRKKPAPASLSAMPRWRKCGGPYLHSLRLDLRLLDHPAPQRRLISEELGRVGAACCTDIERKRAQL